MEVPCFCHLCMMHKPPAELIRLNKATMTVPVSPDDNDDHIICRDCIRAIKRIPFGHLDKSPAVPAFFVLPEPPEPDNDEIPF